MQFEESESKLDNYDDKKNYKARKAMEIPPQKRDEETIEILIRFILD